MEKSATNGCNITNNYRAGLPVYQTMADRELQFYAKAGVKPNGNTDFL